MIDSSTHIGRSALVEGAILGRSCDIRSHVRIHEGVAIGDEVTLGAQSVVMPGVRIYPYKEVESGAQIHESLIWESRASLAPVRQGRRRGPRQRRPDAGGGRPARRRARHGAQARRARRREPRVAAGVPDDQARDDRRPQLDRRRRRRPARRCPRAVSRHLLKTHGYDAGFHVGASATDPEVVQIRFFEQPGIQLTSALQKEIEKHFTRQELRRVGFDEVGDVSYPARVRESYAAGPARVARRATRSARAASGIVVDYGYSAASFVLPLAARPARRRGGLGARVRARAAPAAGGAPARVDRPGEAARAAPSAADLGVVFDRAGERLYLIDERGREIPVEQTLLLFLRLIGAHAAAAASSRSRSPSRARSTEIARGQRARGRPHAARRSPT